MEISGALTDFALALERYLEDFQMVHLVSDAEKLAGFLPRLTELMERSRVLLVIDNGESLLTDTGQWRDERWGQVIGALIAHRGLGRVIVTSRRIPSGGPGAIAPGAAAGSPGLLRESVDALSTDEALLLASELPHLRGLIAGDLPGIERDTAATTMTFAANAAGRLGTAASVVRISPEENSPVIARTPRMATAGTPINSPWKLACVGSKAARSAGVKPVAFWKPSPRIARPIMLTTKIRKIHVVDQTLRSLIHSIRATAVRAVIAVSFPGRFLRRRTRRRARSGRRTRPPGWRNGRTAR